MTLKDHIRQGKDSGFSLCCIVYFLFRLVIWTKTGKLIEFKQPKGSQHVLCPFHILLHKFVPMKRYFNCKTCNWQQYDKSKCVKCVHCKHEYKRKEANCLICGYKRGTIGCIVTKTNPWTEIPVYEERDFGENYENRV